MADTAASSAITDHAFMAPPGEPWARCVYVPNVGDESGPVCGLAQSAHRETLAPYTAELECAPE